MVHLHLPPEALVLLRNAGRRSNCSVAQGAGLVIHTAPVEPTNKPRSKAPKPSKAPNKVHAAHSPNLTPLPPRQPPTRKPLNTWTTFEAAHRAAADQLAAYLDRGRKGSVCLDGDTLTELDRDQAMYLPANNATARMRYARITAEHLDGAIGALAPDQPVFFVTLINRDHTVREDEAASFSVRRLHAWAHRILRGCAFVGMVEAAYYSNLDVTGAGYQRAVSWHIHVIVWGISEAGLAAIIQAANRRYRCMIDGIAPAHYRPLMRSKVFGQALYMNKGQISEYRLWPRKRSVADEGTGEITKVGTGRFSQAKRDLRPGAMARMCLVFAGRRLDKLAFAGGAGKGILSAIRYEADADRRRVEDREAALRAVRHQPRHPVGPRRR